MSGTCKVRVETGQYRCLTCLNIALEQLNLQKVVNIERSLNGYKIVLQNSKELYKCTQKNMDFIYIKNYHEKIFPRYTELHAIHSLTNKGFNLVKRDIINDNYVLILEKRIGSNFPVRVDRYKITVIPHENRILIDGGIMPGDNCRQYAKNFQRTMGKLESFSPYDPILVRNVIKKHAYYKPTLVNDKEYPPYKSKLFNDKKKSPFLTNVCD